MARNLQSKNGKSEVKILEVLQVIVLKEDI